MSPKSKNSTDESEKVSGKRSGVFDVLRRRFLAGLIVITPIAIVIFSIMFLLRQIDKFLGEHIRFPIKILLEMIGLKPDFAEAIAQPVSIGVSTILILVFIIFIGGLSQFLLVRRMIGLGEWVISKVPLVRFFYQTPKEVIKIFTEQKNSVKRVVMVQYPKENTWAMAYVTGELIHGPDGCIMVSVFIPTTPNPTSGFMLLYPVGEVLDMNISTEDAVRMIISGGILSPEVYHTTPFAGLDQIPDLPPSAPLTSGDEHHVVTAEDIAEVNHTHDSEDGSKNN